jgi:flagellar basal-body rod protein FlgB
MTFSTSDVRFLGRALDGLTQRQRAVAANLANQSTPGYKRVEVSFEDQLDRAAAGGSFEPKVTVDRSPGSADGNNVVAEDEIGALTRVEILFQTLTRALGHKAALMREAIRGGR